MIRRSAVAAAIAAAVALIPALAGCAAGTNAQTNQPFATTDGASAVFRGISIRNMFVLGPPPGSALPAGQSASLFLALANNGAPDRLTAVFAPGTASSVTIRGTAVNLAGGQVALLTGPEPSLILERLQRPLLGGIAIPVTLFFQNAGAITLAVPVVPRTQYYVTLSPPPPSPQVTASRKTAPHPARPSGSGSTGASPAATATP